MNDNVTQGDGDSPADQPRQPAGADETNPCPQCAAVRATIESVCPVCGWVPPPARNPVIPPLVTWPMKMEAARTFSLESVMLIVTLLAVCLAAGVLAPGIGILLALLSAPALLRTVLVQLRRKAEGNPMSVAEKSLTFLASLAFVVLILLALLIALFFACLAVVAVANNQSQPASIGLIAVLVLGLVAGITTMTWYSARRK